MLHVGLTGGLASGKSTVASMLRELGAVVIDADEIARDVVAPGTPGLAAVAAAFGQDVLSADGSLDRAALAEVVFGDDAALRSLNAIVHPLVRDETAARVARLPNGTIVVHDVPLLVENRMGAQYHLVVVVGASERLRTQRAVARGLTEAAAVARMAAQADDADRRRAADAWVENEGSEAELRSAVEQLWRRRIVPFAENLATGHGAEPGQPVPADVASRGDLADQADRLIARIARAAGDGLTRIRPRTERGDGVIEIGADAVDGDLTPTALLSAGFVKVRRRTFANADPGRPAVLTLGDEPGPE